MLAIARFENSLQTLNTTTISENLTKIWVMKGKNTELCYFILQRFIKRLLSVCLHVSGLISATLSSLVFVPPQERNVAGYQSNYLSQETSSHVNCFIGLQI